MDHPDQRDVDTNHGAGVLERSLSAGYWSVLDTIFQKVLIYGAFFVTARFLTPHDYGVIALAMVYPNLLDSLTAIAFDTALTQQKEGDERPFLSLVWSFNLARIAIVFIVVLVSAPFFANFFNAEGTEMLFSLAALPLLVQGFANIGQIYFFRRLDWKKVFVRDMWNYGTNAIVTVALAVMTHSYWAIFVGGVAGMTASVIATYALERTRPHLDLRLRRLAPLLSYSEWVFGQGLVSRLATTTEDVVVGHYTDPGSVGNFSKAKSLAYAPTSPLANIIGKVGFSAIVAAEGSLPHIREGFKKSIDVAFAVAAPYSVAIFVFGTSLVRIVLGEDWMGITPLLKTLVLVSGINASMLAICTMVLNAFDRPNLQFRLNLLSFFVTVLTLPYLAITQGVAGAAIALLCVAIVTNCYATGLIQRVIAPDWKRIAIGALTTLFASLAPLAVVVPMMSSSLAESTLFFLLACTIYGSLYIGGVAILGRLYPAGPWATLSLVFSGLTRRLDGKKS